MIFAGSSITESPSSFAKYMSISSDITCSIASPPASLAYALIVSKVNASTAGCIPYIARLDVNPITKVGSDNNSHNKFVNQLPESY